MKTKIIDIVNVFLLIAVFCAVITKRCGSENPHKFSIDSIVAISNHKVDSIIQVDSIKQSLILQQKQKVDTAVKYFYYYADRWHHDTIKGQAGIDCSQIIDRATEAINGYQKLDSIHVSTEQNLRSGISIQKNTIDTLQTTADDLQKQNTVLRKKSILLKKITVISSGLAATIITAVLIRH